MSDGTAIGAPGGPPDAAVEPINRESLDLPARFAPPESDIERKVAIIWRKACNIDRIGLNDDFFDLGGDSLTATLISTAITGELGYKFQPSILMTRSTVAAVASLLEREVGGSDRIEARDRTETEADPPHLVAVRTEGELPPIFFIHGRLGVSFPGPAFMAGLDPRQPVYFIQALGYFDDETPPRRVPEIARVYLETMRRKQPSGPLHIASFCAGGMIAAEIACNLAEKGEPPASLVLVDPPAPPAIATGRKPGFLLIRHRRFRRWWKLFRLNFRLRAAGKHHMAPTSFVDRGAASQYRRQLAAMAEVDPDFDGPIPGMARRAYEALLEAFLTYEPRTYDGPADIISSRERIGGSTAEDHAWHGFVPGLRLHIGGETHSELFRKEAGGVARKVQECVLAGQNRTAETRP